MEKKLGDTPSATLKLDLKSAHTYSLSLSRTFSSDLRERIKGSKDLILIYMK